MLHFVQKYLVVFLVAAYVAAALLPGPGLALRSASVTVRVLGSSLALHVPPALLAVLLFNASFGIDASQLRRLVEGPRIVLGGLAANTVLPLAFIGTAAFGLRLWHNPDEVQNLLVGLAIIGSMPIAGSSTAWSQNSEGNVALSLGLVLGSTLLSPLLTPLGFRVVSHLTTGDYAEDLGELAGAETAAFLVAAVVAPSVLGMGVRRLVGARRARAALPAVKGTNVFALLTLNYSNAAVALPRLIARPDPDALVLVLVVVSALCGLAFWGGDWIGTRLGAGRSERIALMFALGMNNNGSALVLASASLADHPGVLVVIVAYNLVQQLAAGLVEYLSLRRPFAREA